jgi:hypothetical protein
MFDVHMLLQSLGFLIIALKNDWIATIFLYVPVFEKSWYTHLDLNMSQNMWLTNDNWQEVDYKTEYTHMGSCSNYVSWIYIQIIVFNDVSWSSKQILV